MFYVIGGLVAAGNVSDFLGVQRSEIKEIRVYPKVLLVIFTKPARRRPQFVSKIALKPVSIQQFHKRAKSMEQKQTEIKPAVQPVNSELAAALAVTNANAKQPEHMQRRVIFRGKSIA